MKFLLSIFSLIFLMNLANAYDSETQDIYYNLPTKADRACMNIRYHELENEMDTLISAGYRWSLVNEYHEIRCDIAGGQKVDLYRAMIANAQGNYNKGNYLSRFMIVDKALGSNPYYSCAILDKSMDGKTLVEIVNEEIQKIQDLIKVEEQAGNSTFHLSGNLRELESHKIWFEKQTIDYYPITDFATECYPVP